MWPCRSKHHSDEPMAKSVKKHPNSRLFAIRAYLLFVLMLTLLLFTMSIVSFQEQHVAGKLFWGSIITDSQASPDTKESLIQRELWFVGISVVMFLCVLGFGLYFYIRVSWDIRWYQLRSDFVSGVSHEFKTPLSLIRLYSETLAANYEDFSPEDRNNYIRIIARESERLSRLIDNVLDFSKLEQSPKPMTLHEADLAPAISQTVQDYSDYLIWRGFELKTSIQPNLPPVRHSREHISQAVLNLLDNARKYSGVSRIIRLNAWAPPGEVIIEIKDNGIGIPAEEKEKIFLPFYRIPGRDSKGGCGLGLYLAAQVMKEHGGTIEVESNVGEGSAFRLRFPVSDTQHRINQLGRTSNNI